MTDFEDVASVIFAIQREDWRWANGKRPALVAGFHKVWTLDMNIRNAGDSICWQ